MNQQDSRIRTTASSLIEHLALVTHAEPIADPLGCGGATVSWHITAPYGHGTLWCFSIDDATALFSCDFAVAQAVRTSARALDCFLFGTCTRLPGPRTATSNRVNRAPVGRVQQACAPPPMIDIAANETVETYGIALLPPAVRKLSLACHCDPLVLTSAIAALDGTHAIPPLVKSLDEIRTAWPGAVAAPAFFGGKVLECTALLVDWQVARTHYPNAAMSKADRAALARVFDHMKVNLDRPVSTEELCRIACMSATKLTGIFRRAEGKTPQEHLRDLRMDRACKLLATTDLTMAEIAASIGYTRQSSFSEAFKSCQGISPREYRTLKGPQ